MKLLLLIFAVLLFTSQARFTNETNISTESDTKKKDLPRVAEPSTIENKAIVQLSDLYKDLLRFGIKEVAKKYQASNGARFTPNPYNRVNLVRSDKRNGLTVTFDVDMMDNKGRMRKTVLVVNYQAWKKHMGLVNYSVNN